MTMELGSMLGMQKAEGSGKEGKTLPLTIEDGYAERVKRYVPVHWVIEDLGFAHPSNLN